MLFKDIYIIVVILVFVVGLIAIGYFTPEDLDEFHYYFLVAEDLVGAISWPWTVVLCVIAGASWGTVKLLRRKSK